MTGKGTGFGKIILFGEHFVVYGLPAIASAIGDTTISEVEGSDKYELVDNRPATEGYKVKKKGEMDRSMKLLLDFMKIDVEKTPLKITMSGNLFCTSGIGASAAMATSIARALSEHFGLNLNDEQINRISYEGEKGSAGTPSGIDNTCATFGGLLWFEKNLEGGENKIGLIETKGPIDIVLGSTGLSSVTSEVVADVRKAKEADPEKYDRIFREYSELVMEARKAIEEHDIEKIGRLMDKNHELLKEMDLSCDEAERIISMAKENGATGAKITGTGRGGYVITLTPTKEIQDKVSKAIQDAGFRTMKTTIGG
jgi:mevalonate kinase